MDSYEQLLDRAKEKLPDKSDESERFNIPKVKGHVEGNKTIVSNFIQIAQALQRTPDHFLKYILKELATPGEVVKQAAIFKSKVSASKINEKIQQYADEFVVCRACGRPDTKLTKEGNIFFIKCQACGSKHSVYTRQ
ncbi:MAG: translation initiation factor IF-2 subunit beta [Nanoarchaeota archaeon]